MTDYYERAGLDRYLDELGFNTVGYGCTTCIGNSGPLRAEISQAIAEGDLVACAVLSGNRNFEARIHPEVKANYLASPPLVVAYALAGRIDIDLEREPLGQTPTGEDVYPPRPLADLGRDRGDDDALACARRCSRRPTATSSRATRSGASSRRPAATSTPGRATPPTSASRPTSRACSSSRRGSRRSRGARCLVSLGDSVTTDHISPAGSIRSTRPPAATSSSTGSSQRDFNSYGARRGNHEVMVRGTFANVRLRNLLVPGSEGSWTMHFPSGEELTIFDASEPLPRRGNPADRPRRQGVRLGLLARLGRQGPAAARRRAPCIAESYERIHRSNLLMMGILPLQYREGESRESLGLTGAEQFSIDGLEDGEAREVTVRADGRVHGAAAPRHPEGARVPPPRRHPPLRASGKLRARDRLRRRARPPRAVQPSEMRARYGLPFVAACTKAQTRLSSG